MAQHSWTLTVTDSSGDTIRVNDTTFTNPYVSDDTAQQIADRILDSVAPGYLHATDERPRELTVSVWRDKDPSGDPLATARWTDGGS
jgi:hypothetical protein